MSVRNEWKDKLASTHPRESFILHQAPFTWGGCWGWVCGGKTQFKGLCTWPIFPETALIRVCLVFGSWGCWWRAPAAPEGVPPTSESSGSSAAALSGHNFSVAHRKTQSCLKGICWRWSCRRWIWIKRISWHSLSFLRNFRPWAVLETPLGLGVRAPSPNSDNTGWSYHLVRNCGGRASTGAGVPRERGLALFRLVRDSFSWGGRPVPFNWSIAVLFLFGMREVAPAWLISCSYTDKNGNSDNTGRNRDGERP